MTFVVVRTWDGDRKLERQLKNRHAGRRRGPICNGRHPVQMALLPGVCAFTPADESAVTLTVSTPAEEDAEVTG